MAESATSAQQLDLIAAGSRVIVRDQDWQVIELERHSMGSRAIVRCIGRSELVRDQAASFFSDLDVIEPEDPTRTRFRLDTSPSGVETRLVLESVLHRTPVPVSNTDLTVGHLLLADDLPFQREPFRKATTQLQPRLLIADAVGLGKTIEVGMLLAELQRRGRANRVLAVVPRHILDQIQHELWCRCAFPLVRLDSEGIQRVRQRIPAGRNPFTYFNRVIVSIDTIKNPSRYRHHLERVRWDAVWIDEAHSATNRASLRSQVARVLAPNADALILTTATPHNGKSESFAELISLLDPTAVPDPKEVTAEDIEHLVIRRHKKSPDVEAVIGDRWAERAEPVPVAVIPSPDEEAVFAELSETWLNPEKSAPCEDRLFPYTLLKGALSSPAALSESIDNRLNKYGTAVPLDPSTPTDSPEVEALRRLRVKAQEAMDNAPAKLAKLVATLREIGVDKESNVRVVIFSERVRTLDWIAEAVRDELGMADKQVETFHNSKSDEEQQQIVEAFSMASAPIRVLVTSDIASEGVNLHKQCHHLIHFDLPWSLITLEQRNGRIDRYGQLHRPEIRYLIYNPADEETASDVRVVSKLVEKENTAHKALGDAASVMGLYSESAEQSAIIDALRKRTTDEREAALEEAVPTANTFDPWAFAGLDTPPEAESSAPPVATSPVPSLFNCPDDFLRVGATLVYGDLSQIGWETDGQVLSFEPPQDLLRRLDALPQSYLRQRNLAGRLRLTTDQRVATQSLDDAVNAKADSGDTGTAWPEVHYLGPQHPVLDWLADKLLYRVQRNEAIAIACAVDAPTVLVSGVWSNKLGEPIASVWLAATIEDEMVTFADMFPTLAAAGVAEGMVNPVWQGDMAVVEAQLGPIVTAVESNLAAHMEGPLEKVSERLEATRTRLERWQISARAVADEMKPGPHRDRRFSDIDRVTRQIEGLIADNTAAPSPLIRVIGALVPRN
ncbi:MAG: DEAD/DEAH box helicase [Candidatus Nanopelagicales bacterium]